MGTCQITLSAWMKKGKMSCLFPVGRCLSRLKTCLKDPYPLTPMKTPGQPHQAGTHDTSSKNGAGGVVSRKSNRSTQDGTISSFAKAGLRSEGGLGNLLPRPFPCVLPQIFLQGLCDYLLMRDPGVRLMDLQIEVCSRWACERQPPRRPYIAFDNRFNCWLRSLLRCSLLWFFDYVSRALLPPYET